MTERRVDESGAAYAGSQLQTQLYVNRRTEELDKALKAELAGLEEAEIAWRSPLAEEGYAEYCDEEFLRKVGLEQHADALRGFWPRSGPRWDALASLSWPDSDRPGVLLVEGKSYPEELFGKGCEAVPGSPSRKLIEESLTVTQRQLKVTPASLEAWCGRLYQSANRLAHLSWLRSLGVRAWLVHLLFVDDPHRPTSAAQWHEAIEAANAELGLPAAGPEYVGHLPLPAHPRAELFA